MKNNNNRHLHNASNMIGTDVKYFINSYTPHNNFSRKCYYYPLLIYVKTEVERLSPLLSHTASSQVIELGSKPRQMAFRVCAFKYHHHLYYKRIHLKQGT